MKKSSHSKWKTIVSQSAPVGAIDTWREDKDEDPWMIDPFTYEPIRYSEHMENRRLLYIPGYTLAQ